MIDLHCHILPGVDDGPDDLRQSIEMAKVASKDGVRKIVATPHHHTSKFTNPKSIIVEKVKELNEALQAESIPIEVLSGQEVRLFGELIQEFEENQIATVNNYQYVLIEFPSNHVPSYAERMFYEIQMKGLTPIIVHPERNSQIIENPEKLFHLVEKGALSQITAASITGSFGKKLQKFCFQLIESNLTHVIASDAHNTTTRSFHLTEAYDVIEEKFGIEKVYTLKENAELIIQGQPVYKDYPEVIKKKKFLGLF